ncbi:hypothetical protein Tco_0923818 [Tanacetum coccineum]|uniref:Uncharacterized protein n=1 Tax=Tanacetum coccineum TaxID=301880 RepID=A0ABQ5D959_9ASTR
MSGTHDEIPPPPPPPQETQQKPTQQTPQTVSTIKLPILKKGEYDIWAMKIEHYLAHTDYPIWEVIQNGNGPVSVTLDTTGQIKILPPKTAEEMVLRERERKARTTLLMAIPEDHLAKFHKMTDAKDMWNAIKSRFGGNDESKKMQKYILKQQFEGFTVSNSDGIHKGYERFQSLLSQLEIHGAGVSTEDANQKFLRSLPSAWLQVSLIMRNKPGMDSLSFDDLYNNLRVFKNDVKGSTASSSNLQNVAFVSENTNSTNDVSTAYGVSNTSGHNSKHEQTSSYSCSGSDTRKTQHESDFENLPLNKRLAKTCEMQAVPPPMTGNYLPSGPDVEIDDSQYTYGPAKTQPELDACDSNISTESSELYESDSDDEFVSIKIEDLDTPSFANKQVKTPRENVKHQSTNSQKPKVNTKSWDNGITQRGYSMMSDVRSANVFHTTNSPSSRLFKRTTVLKTNLSNQKVYTAKVKEVSTVGEKWVIAVKSSASLDGSSTYRITRLTLPDFQRRLMVPFALEVVKAIITGKGKIKTSLFTDTGNVLSMSPDFKLLMENQILLQVPRQNNKIDHVKLQKLKLDLRRGEPCQMAYLQSMFQNDHTLLLVRKESNTKLLNARTHSKWSSSREENMTLIELQGAMLADSFLPNTFWAEAVSTACYVLNRDDGCFLRVKSSPSPTPTGDVPNESLPDSTSAQPSEVPFEQQPDHSPSPSPRPSQQPSPTPIVPDSIPEHTGENLGDHSSNDQSLSGNEDAMTLQNVYDLCISLCKQVSDQAKELITRS